MNVMEYVKLATFKGRKRVIGVTVEMCEHGLMVRFLRHNDAMGTVLDVNQHKAFGYKEEPRMFSKSSGKRLALALSAKTNNTPHRIIFRTRSEYLFGKRTACFATEYLFDSRFEWQTNLG